MKQSCHGSHGMIMHDLRVIGFGIGRLFHNLKTSWYHQLKRSIFKEAQWHAHLHLVGILRLCAWP